MNKIKEKMQNFSNGKKEFKEYLQQERNKNRYDPRKDLKSDSEYWQAVLKEAEKQDKKVYSNLHGLRCVGCKLKLSKGKLKLIPGEAIGRHWQSKAEWKQARQEYLIPYKDTIKAVFETVEREVVNNEDITKIAL